MRVIAVGSVRGEVLPSIYTDRGAKRRIISLRQTNRRQRNAYRSVHPI